MDTPAEKISIDMGFDTSAALRDTPATLAFELTVEFATLFVARLVPAAGCCFFPAGGRL
jgi:hypothetical protein